MEIFKIIGLRTDIEVLIFNLMNSRLRLKCDGTRAEIRFRLSAKRTRVHLNRRGASVQPRCAHPR